jgi:hypothetical protein
VTRGYAAASPYAIRVPLRVVDKVHRSASASDTIVRNFKPRRPRSPRGVTRRERAPHGHQYRKLHPTEEGTARAEPLTRSRCRGALDHIARGRADHPLRAQLFGCRTDRVVGRTARSSRQNSAPEIDPRPGWISPPDRRQYWWENVFGAHGPEGARAVRGPDHLHPPKIELGQVGGKKLRHVTTTERLTWRHSWKGGRLANKA